jgi:hypothetical protein
MRFELYVRKLILLENTNFDPLIRGSKKDWLPDEDSNLEPTG